MQVMLPLVFRDGAVQNAVHVAGNGGHGGLQLVGDVGDEFLTPVLALLQGGCHVVEGDGHFLHFLGVIVVQPYPGFQIAVAEGVGGFRQLFQRAALPPGKGGDGQHGDQHHEQRRGEEDVGDLIHDLGDVIGRCGDQHDAPRVPVHENGAGDHVAAVGVQAVDDPGGGVAAAANDLLQIRLIQLQALMLTAGGSVGAEHHVPLAVADHGVGAGYLRGHGQVQLKRPVVHSAVVKIGGGQLRDGVRVLL